MEDLIERLEKATGPNFDLERQIFEAVATPEAVKYAAAANIAPPRYTSSIDAALTLVPKTACNLDIFNFVGHGRNDIGQTAWGAHFHDQAQLVGPKRAKAEVARLRKDLVLGSQLRGEPKIVFEKAIAEQFCQFSGTHTPNAAIALCIAALKSRTSIKGGE